MIIKNIRVKIAFTLVELIIVIAIITLLASIIIIVINPSVMFANARNSQRANDIQTLQSAINRYLAESTINGSQRSLFDLIGFSTLYAQATINNQMPSPGVSSNCPGGSSGITNASSINGYWNLDNSGTILNSINVSVLLNNGYLSKNVSDPLDKSPYRACIDNLNSNNLVLYAPNTENQTSFPTAAINTSKYSIPLWDSFDRVDNALVPGNADTGQSYTIVGGQPIQINNKKAYANGTPGVGARINTGSSDGVLSANLSVGGQYRFRYDTVAGTYWVIDPQPTYLAFFQQTPAFTWVANNLPYSPGDNIEVSYHGSNVILYRNGNKIFSTVDSFNSDKTYIDFDLSGGGTTGNFTVDNFLYTN